MDRVAFLTTLSQNKLLAISNGELPDTLLMGFNHLRGLGLGADILSLGMLQPSILHTLGSTTSKFGGFSLLARKLVAIPAARESNLVACKNIIPISDSIGNKVKIPFAIMDVIVYEHQPFRWILGKLIQSASFITYNTRAEGILLSEEFGLEEDSMEYLPWGVDKTFFRPEGPNSPGASRRFLVLSVGNASRDYITLAKALRLLGKDIDWTIVTGGPLKFRRHEKKYDLRSISSIYERTRILPRCHPSELKALYHDASVVVVPVYPSASASGVTSALEAMAMEKACIVTASRGLSDYVEDGRNAIVCQPLDYHDLASMLLAMYRDKTATGNLGRFARQTIEREFNTERVAWKLRGILTTHLR